ncbi:CDP-alcohol phosphatidyltransferase family protein [Mucilaginibacter sp.]|uniref:CDP-alcohol phosphatidyltransferase family protein n=1 Tax=Mucilaginibacter sp. TaxID=1882438 RepID=UPI00260C2AFA|nr:CDP-alcohol phosphatidyltransferase family protein [Mucilaginibacter sp.]MDB4924430.1 CDP-alcohol phosphatidyltransferase [Mucilaginibacter sp.]
MKNSYYIINGITLYRMIAAPLLIYLVFINQFNLFKWLLVVSFFTDAIDGYFARRYQIKSAFGATIDSVADDLTIVAAIIGMYVQNPAFLLKEIIPIVILLVLYLSQNTLAFIKYRKMTSFHTYVAKIAAVCQGIFLIAFFFLPQPVYWLFYLTLILTGIDLIEEIMLIILLPHYRTNVKGLYWLKK